MKSRITSFASVYREAKLLCALHSLIKMNRISDLNTHLGLNFYRKMFTQKMFTMNLHPKNPKSINDEEVREIIFFFLLSNDRILDL